eukprot:2656296-Amphidinium_carterae.2
MRCSGLESLKLALSPRGKFVGTDSPHLVLEALVLRNGFDFLKTEECLDANSVKRVVALEQQKTEFIPLALWGDGVPFSWHRHETVQ